MEIKPTNPQDDLNQVRRQMIEDAIRNIIIAVGDDPDREGLKDTPKRVAKMYLNELTIGIGADLTQELTTVFAEENHRELVIVKDIDFFSLCEHHLVTYFGKVHIGYIPNGTVVGISKLARLVERAARTFSIQERLGTQIADTIVESLDPLGVIVVIEAQHMCMMSRGIKKPGSTTVTSSIRGIFKTNDAARAEFMNLIK